MTPEEIQAIEDKKVADNAAREQAARKRSQERAVEFSKLPITIVGDGAAFNIDGPGLGMPGRLTIGGQDVPTTRWEDRTVRGQIPEGVRGEVVLMSGDGIVRKGQYPSAAKAAPTTPATTATK